MRVFRYFVALFAVVWFAVVSTALVLVVLSFMKDTRPSALAINLSSLVVIVAGYISVGSAIFKRTGMYKLAILKTIATHLDFDESDS